MHYIRRLPVLVALVSAIVTGLIGYISNRPNQDNVLKMTIVMVIFYMVGLVIRETITGIAEEIKKKTISNALEIREQQSQNTEQEQQIDSPEIKGGGLNLVADEDINPEISEEELKSVTSFIQNELSKQ